MTDTLFYIFRTMTIAFAALMLVKYFIFLLVAPFYKVQELRRRIRLTKVRQAKGNEPYQPKVSVIIPAWNEEVGIRKTVNSVIENHYPNTEIIVVNDGSTDNSDSVMKDFVTTFNRSYRPDYSGITIYYHYKANGGKGTALNYGINHASGEIVVTIDADSALDSNALHNLVAYFEDPTIDTAVGNVKVGTNPTLVGMVQQLEYLFGFYFKRTHAVLGSEYIFGGACSAFRKSTTFDALGLFDEVNKTEDIEMSMRTRFYGLHCAYAEDVVCYTEGASSISGLISQRLRWKKGRFDTFVRYRSMFFSLEKRHNKALTWFILPFALLSELQLLFEPIAITLLVAYSIIASDYISLGLGILFVFISYLVTSVFNQGKVEWRVLGLAFLTWPLFYLLVWVEYIALLKSLGMLLRGKEVEWQQWQRQGIGGAHESS